MSFVLRSVQGWVMAWGSAVEVERRRRIAVAVWAYAYEIDNDHLVPDHVYDDWARRIDVAVSTGNARLDTFFRAEFSPHTGMWVRKHPGFDRLGDLAAVARARGKTYGIVIAGDGSRDECRDVATREGGG